MGIAFIRGEKQSTPIISESPGRGALEPALWLAVYVGKHYPKKGERGEEEGVLFLNAL